MNKIEFWSEKLSINEIYELYRTMFDIKEDKLIINDEKYNIEFKYNKRDFIKQLLISCYDGRKLELSLQLPYYVAQIGGHNFFAMESKTISCLSFGEESLYLKSKGIRVNNHKLFNIKVGNLIDEIQLQLSNNESIMCLDSNSFNIDKGTIVKITPNGIFVGTPYHYDEWLLSSDCNKVLKHYGRSVPSLESVESFNHKEELVKIKEMLTKNKDNFHQFTIDYINGSIFGLEDYNLEEKNHEKNEIIKYYKVLLPVHRKLITKYIEKMDSLEKHIFTGDELVDINCLIKGFVNSKVALESPKTKVLR